MATYEEEYKRIEKVVLFLSKLMLFPKKIDLRGAGNFVRDGPNIITSNHNFLNKSLNKRFPLC